MGHLDPVLTECLSEATPSVHQAGVSPQSHGGITSPPDTSSAAHSTAVFVILKQPWLVGSVITPNRLELELELRGWAAPLGPTCTLLHRYLPLLMQPSWV